MITPNVDNTITQHKYDYKFIMMRSPQLGERKEPFAVRLANYMNKYTITISRFVELCEEYRGVNGARVTRRDICNYLYDGISPKIDKLYTISRVMGVPIAYFCGYGCNTATPKNSAVRYHKTRKKVA